MPVKPDARILAKPSVDILNAILNGGSAAYQERVPVATRENIRDVGAAILDTQATMNEFLSSLINRVGRVLIVSRLFYNPLKEFKQGMLEYGESIEEIFINIAKAHQYDPAVAETEVFKREIPDVAAIFHRMNYQNFYKATIHENDLHLAFLSAEGVADLIGKVIEQMNTGAELDEFLNMKNLILDYGTKGYFYPVGVSDASDVQAVVKTIKSYSNKLKFMSNQYNAMGVSTHTPIENQILLIDTDFDAAVDVDVLAAAFNMDKAQFLARRVLVDDFGGLTGVLAILCDKNWFRVYDNLNRMAEQYNGQGLYWNYFLHVWKTFSTSPFSNAVLFLSGTPTISSVNMTAPTYTVKKGASLQLSVEVTTTNYAPHKVNWAVSGAGALAAGTAINENGLLTVGAGETNAELTVTATSIFDNTKSDTATIAVTA